jgi:tetratricopeptide (TPR) repeat protein
LESLQPGVAVIVIGADSGSGNDVTARLVAAKLPTGNTPNDQNGVPALQAGELLYTGKITGVLSINTFTISLTTTTNGNGENNELDEPQPRNILLDEGAVLYSRQEPARKLTISDLKIGQRVTLIGKEAGARTIKARDVAVWDDDAGEARSLGIVTVNRQTAQYLSKGDEARRVRAFEEALKAYNQALLAAMNANDPAGQATTHNRLGLLYDELGQPGRALESFQKSLETWKRANNSNSEATTWLNLSGHYYDQKDLENASAAIQNSIRLFGNNNLRALAIAYSRLGSIQADQDKLTDALISWQQALGLARRAQERDEEIAVLEHLTMAYAMLGQSDKAQDDAEQLVALLPQIADQNVAGGANYSLGLAYKYLKQKAKAKEFLTQALALWKQAGRNDSAAAAQKQLDQLAATPPTTAAAAPPTGAIVPAN